MDDVTLDQIEQRNQRVRIFLYLMLALMAAGIAAVILVTLATARDVRDISASDHVLLERQQAQLADLQRLANQQAEHLQEADRNRDILQARVIQLQEALGASGVDIPPPTDEQIAAQVAAYCATGACTGPPGPEGPPGQTVCVRPNGRVC